MDVASIPTERLELISFTPDVMRAVVDSDLVEAGRRLGAAFPAARRGVSGGSARRFRRPSPTGVATSSAFESPISTPTLNVSPGSAADAGSAASDAAQPSRRGFEAVARHLCHSSPAPPTEWYRSGPAPPTISLRRPLRPCGTSPAGLVGPVVPAGAVGALRSFRLPLTTSESPRWGSQRPRS